MSEIIYNRAAIREKAIWPSFLYGMPGIEPTKAIVFGLYANTYLLGHNYLRDIEAEELQRLVDTYDSNMAELDVDEQRLVLEIASQRYLKTIEIQIKNNALTTKAQQLSADEQDYDAKLAALGVDQEALGTKRAQIELARDRADLKNKDLIARIQLEELAQDYVAVEISQKQLEVAMSEVKVLTTALRGLEIQVDIADASYRIVELESSKADIRVDIKMIELRTEENRFTGSGGGTISGSKLFAEEKSLSAMEYEINSSELEQKKIELIEKRGDTIEGEKDFIINTSIVKEAELKIEQQGKQTEQQKAIIQTFDDREKISADFVDQSDFTNDSNEAIALKKRDHGQALWDKDKTLYVTRKIKLTAIKDASVAAAEKLAMADIVTSLTHEIGSA